MGTDAHDANGWLTDELGDADVHAPTKLGRWIACAAQGCADRWCRGHLRASYCTRVVAEGPSEQCELLIRAGEVDASNPKPL